MTRCNPLSGTSAKDIAYVVDASLIYYKIYKSI